MSEFEDASIACGGREDFVFIQGMGDFGLGCEKWLNGLDLFMADA